VELLLWLFVIAPCQVRTLLGTFTVIFKSEYRCNAMLQFSITSVVRKKCPKSNEILRYLDSVNMNVVTVNNCYCEKLFWVLFLFRIFFVWMEQSDYLYWCSVLSIIFVQCSATRTKVLYERQTHNAIDDHYCRVCGSEFFLWQSFYAIDCVVQMLF